MARERPRGVLLAMLRLPPLFYRLGLAGRLGPRLLLLTTRGRRTGRPRSCGLNYAEADGVVYVVSGFGERTDWYRNLVIDPHVEVQIGTRRWRAIARTVTDPAERRRALASLKRAAHGQGPPAALRPLIARLGLDYDGELAAFDADAPGMPVVALSGQLAPT